jgi:hypothetical protein
MNARPTPRQLLIAAVCLVMVLGAAFAAAHVTRHDPIFKLTPPPDEAAPNVVAPADVQEAQRLDLHRTFFTAWAALLLVTPALCLFPFRNSSSTAAGYWLAFWTAGLLAFAVHLYWAVIVIFDGDWSRITNTTRVSAPVIDTVFAIWWGLDVLLAWSMQRENRIIRIERTIVSLLAFVLFVAGSVIEGEIWLSKAVGFVMAGAVAIAVLAWLARRLRVNAASRPRP